jgi:carboxylesterase
VNLIPGGEPFFFRGGPVGALLVHGFTGAPREMRPLGEALATAGHTVLGVRLTHHATQPQDMFRSTWQDWYASVLDGYFILRDQCETVFVMGLSMGGTLALCLAADQPVAGVVALSAPSRPRLEAMDWRTRYTRLFSFFVKFVPKGPPDQKADPKHVHYPRYPVLGIGQLRRLLEELDRRLPNITTPTLVVHSRRDRSVLPTNGQYIFDHLGSRQKELLWLEQSGHIVTEGPERDRVSAAVVNFMAAPAAQRPAPALALPA